MSPCHIKERPSLPMGVAGCDQCTLGEDLYLRKNIFENLLFNYKKIRTDIYTPTKEFRNFSTKEMTKKIRVSILLFKILAISSNIPNYSLLPLEGLSLSTKRVVCSPGCSRLHAVFIITKNPGWWATNFRTDVN